VAPLLPNFSAIWEEGAALPQQPALLGSAKYSRRTARSWQPVPI